MHSLLSIVPVMHLPHLQMLPIGAYLNLNKCY